MAATIIKGQVSPESLLYKIRSGTCIVMLFVWGSVCHLFVHNSDNLTFRYFFPSLLKWADIHPFIVSNLSLHTDFIEKQETFFHGILGDSLISLCSMVNTLLKQSPWSLTPGVHPLVWWPDLENISRIFHCFLPVCYYRAGQTSVTTCMWLHG